jgi:hypothetical protein
VQAPGHAKAGSAALNGNALDFLRVVMVVFIPVFVVVFRLSIVVMVFCVFVFVVIFLFNLRVVVVLLTVMAVMLLREGKSECTTIQPSLSAEEQLVAVPSEPAATVEVG